MSEDEGPWCPQPSKRPLGSDLDPGSGGLQVQAARPRKTLRFESLGPWAFPGEVCRSLGPEGQARPGKCFEGAERRQPEQEVRQCARDGSAAGGWGGAADSRDGWLRPLGAAGGPGARGVAGLEDLGAGETAEEGGGEQEPPTDSAPAPLLLASLPHSTAARPQVLPRRRDSGRRDPIPEASLGKLAELARETPSASPLETSQLSQSTQRKGERERKKRVILLPVLKRNPWEREREKEIPAAELKIPGGGSLQSEVGSREALGEGARTASSDPLRRHRSRTGLSYGSNSPPAPSPTFQLEVSKRGTAADCAPQPPALRQDARVPSREKKPSSRPSSSTSAHSSSSNPFPPTPPLC